MPESDALPEPRAVADLFPPTRDGVTVLLAIPPRKPNGFNCALEPETGTDARYLAEARVLHDENTGADERTVRLGRKNLRLLMDTEPAGDLLTLARRARGARRLRPLRLRRQFRAARAADQRQRAAHGAGAAPDRNPRRKERHASRAARGKGGLEFSTREIANFWLLHAVNSALAPLRHLVTSKRGHPEELFLEMSRLAGALCTFALDSHPRDLPLYDHQNLSECFGQLDAHIRAHLETIVPTNCLSIPLHAARRITTGKATSPTSAAWAARAGCWPFAPTWAKPN